MKDLFAAASIGLTIVLGLVYVIQAATGRKHAPHVATWAMLTGITGSAALLQLTYGAGVGAIPSAITAVFNGVNCIVGLRKRGKREVTLLSKTCIGMAAIAVIAWLAVGTGTLAAVLLTTASAIAFLPTVVRTWDDPLAEPQRIYWWNTGRYLLGVLAVEHYSWATALYPATWVAINTAFSIYHRAALRRSRPTSQAAASTAPEPSPLDA